VVAWRLLRQAACCVGLLHEEEGLREAWSHLEKSPWDTPLDQVSRPGVLAGRLSRSLWAREVRELLTNPPACPLLPPQIPDAYMVTDALRQSYDPTRPDHDPALHRYVRALERCASRLRIGETRNGRWGLRGLLDPVTVRDLFPTREELEDFEDVLADAVLEGLVQHGDRSTSDWLRDSYGLTMAECSGLIAQVDDLATRRQSRTTDQWRTRILAMLDVVRQQASEALDVRTARWAIRDMASVSGVLKTEADDLMRDMERAVDTLDAEDRTHGPRVVDDDEREAVDG
jgi:hypothetical protein